MNFLKKVSILLWIVLLLSIANTTFATLPDPHNLPSNCSWIEAGALCRPDHSDPSTQFYIAGGNSSSCPSSAPYRAQIRYSSCNTSYVHCGNGAYSIGGLPPQKTITPCSYISSWSEVRSICKNLSKWNVSGEATCEQTVTWSANYSSGTNPPGCPSNKPRPADYTDKVKLTIKYNSTTCNSNDYANNTDKCNVKFVVDGIPSQGVVGLEGQSATDAVFDNNNIYRNQVDLNDAGGALTVPSTTMQKINKTNYNLVFNSITSIVPFEKTSSFGFKLDGDSISKSGITMGFKKPFVGSLYISGDDLKIGTEQTLVLDVAELSNLTNRHISNYANSLKAVDADYVVQDINGETNLTTNPRVNMTLNYIGEGQIGKSAVQTSPYIDYTIGANWVKYYLSKTSVPTDNNPIVSEEGKFYGVKILGLYQGKGKLYISGQDENNSDISTIEYRNQIKKNIGILTRDMTNGQKKNGVWYIEGGNHSLYELYQNNGNTFSDVSTIVVHNGNITLDAGINKGNRMFGIVVTKDDYNDKSIGNIFVTPNVRYISAVLFADGGLISLGGGNTIESVKSGTYKDTTLRTSVLKKQLVLEGVLISRNTIGGALKGKTGTYILPGGKTTTDFDKAVMYDLDYIRRGVNPADDDHNRGYNKNPFVIIYDSRIQTNPPLGFKED